MKKTPICFVGGEKIQEEAVLNLLSEKEVNSLFIPCWKTMIKIPDEIVERAFKFGEEFEKKYEDFSFKIITSYKPDIRNEQRCKLMVVYSPTKDSAYMRGNKIMCDLKLEEFPQIKGVYYRVKGYPSNFHAGEGDDIHIGSEGEKLVNSVKSILDSKLGH